MKPICRDAGVAPFGDSAFPYEKEVEPVKKVTAPLPSANP
jgi:hypothetical protein